MRGRVLAFAVLAVVAGGSPQTAAAQSVAPDELPAAPRTPWGDPDLQGLWNHGTITPLERPPEYAGRERLTDEEIAAANLASETRATSERRSELTREQDVALAYNQFWWDRGISIGRTSLITDPPDGRLPPRTPERLEYEATPEAQRLAAAKRGRVPAHGPEDMDLGDRCLVYRHVPITSSGYNNHVHVLQSPGYVAIFQEQIHDFRIIPVFEQPALPDQVRLWLGVVARPLGGRHAGRRDEQLPRADRLSGIGLEPPRRRAVHPARCGRRRVLVHGDRSERLDATVERDGAVASRRGPDVRVRLSRGQLRHDESPHVVAGGRGPPLRSTKTIVEEEGKEV